MSEHWRKLDSFNLYSECLEYLKKHRDELKVADEPEDMNTLHHVLNVVSREYGWDECDDPAQVRLLLDPLLKPDDAYERETCIRKWVRQGVAGDTRTTFFRAYIVNGSALLVLYLAKEVLEMPDSELHALIVDLIMVARQCPSDSHYALAEWVELGISPVGLFEALCKKARDRSMKTLDRSKLGHLLDFMFTYPAVVRFVLKRGDPKKKSCVDFVNSAVEHFLPNKKFAHTRASGMRQRVFKMLDSEVLQSLIEPESE